MSAEHPGVHPDPRVCAIVVTYHPDAEFPERLAQIKSQVGAVVIVDNGSAGAELDMLHALATAPAITLKLNHANLGIATALNIGVELARTSLPPPTWVLLLDQDSCVATDMVHELIAAQESFALPAELAVIGSGFRDTNKHVPAEADADVRAEEVDNVITSGSLIPLLTHAIVGPFRDEFFIDHVDREYCLRARAKGFRIIKTRKELMTHAIGAYSQHRGLLKKNKWTSNHSPDRRYYFARNDTVMLREYGGYVLGLWRLKSFRRCLQVCKRIALYEYDKTAKIMAVAQGWWHGIRGRLGPRRPPMRRPPMRRPPSATD